MEPPARRDRSPGVQAGALPAPTMIAPESYENQLRPVASL